jgi:hypothetical protein
LPINHNKKEDSILLNLSNSKSISGGKFKRLSEAILLEPKSLSENNTKLVLNDKLISIIDYIESVKLQNLLIISLNNNNINSISPLT